MRVVSRPRGTDWRVAATAVVGLALGACSSSQDVLDPSHLAPQQTVAGATDSATTSAAPTPGPTPGTTTASTTQTQAPTGTRIRFAPIVGPSVEAATALSQSLTTSARQRGIVAAGPNDDSGYMLRGYFTRLVEGREVTGIYVWDVYDAKGNRVHRISGQEKARAGSGDGWDAVPNSSMQAIGNSTVEQFASWVASHG